jgi:hypothetical protein
MELIYSTISDSGYYETQAFETINKTDFIIYLMSFLKIEQILLIIYTSFPPL